MKKIGFIGLGNMGTPMAKNLLKANYDIIGFDVNTKLIEDMVPNGMEKASNLKNIAKLADIIITMLPNGEIVNYVYETIINTVTQIHYLLM